MTPFQPAARAVLACMVVAVLAVAASATARDDEPAAPQERLTFNMLAQHIGTGPSGQTPVMIVVERFNTLDERDALLEIFQSGGMQALADALRDREEVGFIRAPRVSNTGWQLRYAVAFSDGKGGRIFRLATDRPISFAEAMARPTRTWDYNVSLIELVLDENGEGTGTMIVGAEFAYDQTNGAFTLKSVSSEPVRLVNVRTEIQQAPASQR